MNYGYIYIYLSYIRDHLGYALSDPGYPTGWTTREGLDASWSQGKEYGNMGFYGKNDMNMGFFLGFSWRYGRWEAKKHDHHMGFLGISSNFMAMYGDLMRILWEFKGSMGTYGLPCGDFSMGIYWNIFCNFRVWDGPGVHMYSEILLTLW